MLKIKWKGIDSDTIPGILICELPPITKPKIKTAITKIDGRDGDIIEELGYESYTKSIRIGLVKNYDIDQIIKYFTGEGKLILSNESDKEYNCRIIEKIDYEKLLKYKTATIKFYTQPFKYLVDEEKTDITLSDKESIIVINKGFEISKPIFTLHGTGAIEININGSSIFKYTFPEEETEVIIDSQNEEAYLNGIYKNRNMVGEFPLFNPGENTITWTGNLTRIEIEPKSRWL